MFRHGFSAELDPENAEHQAWLARLQEVLAAVPEGLTCTQDKPFELRVVTQKEFLQFLVETRFHSFAVRGDSERMWGVLVRLCGKQLGAEVPADREQTKTFPLPLKVIKQVTLGHFAESATVKRTQDTILAFIASL